jgi:AGZA family xanthine/uracil permease-like MFS transporter
MSRGLAEIDWQDITESAPVTALMMPLTYSIANGIGLGFITYALAKVLAGRFQGVNAPVWLLAALFAIKFALPG